jgi:hypothetical protein
MNTFFLSFSKRKLKVTDIDDNHTINYITMKLIPSKYPEFFKGRELYLKLSYSGKKLSKDQTYFNIRTLGELEWHEGKPLLIGEIGPEYQPKNWKCTVQ